MKEAVILVAAVAAALGITAGLQSSTFKNSVGSTAQPAASSEESISADGSFAHNLDMLMPRDKNYMFSPFSIKAALTLAADGADGETLAEMEKVLQSGDINQLNTDIQALTKRYESLEGTELKIADSIWLNTDVANKTVFNKNYAATVMAFFNTEPYTVDSSNAVNSINNWCSEHTNGKIEKIIDRSDFLAALVNAVYFNGKWEYQFDKDVTQKRTFTDRNGNKTDIDFMNKTREYNFYKDNDIKILELPYSDGKLAMYAYLSNDKRIDIAKYFDKLDSTEVKVSIPKFKTEYSAELSADLQKLGLKLAFDPNAADFKKMFEDYSPDDNFYIDEVLHKTYIDVTEEGTEAAAATAVIMKRMTSAVGEKPKPEEFIADKPFGYCIADRETHEILFMGEYAFAE